MASNVSQEEGKDEVPVEILATSIVAISEGVKKLRAGRLNDKALVLLIQHSCPAGFPGRPSVKVVKQVLDAMEGLERTYLKKK